MIEKTKGFKQVLLLCSTSNISRIQVMLEVAKANNLTPIEDILLANVLSTLPHPLPNPINDPNIYCFLPSYYYRKRNIDKFKPYIDPFKDKISKTGKMLHGNFIMNVRVSMLQDIEKLCLKSKVLNNAVLIYSIWLRLYSAGRTI